SSRRRHTRSLRDWSSDVCSSDLIGASIGIVRSHDCPDIEQLFHNADLALYRVKAEGRNNFRLFEPEMDEAARERRQLEAALRVRSEERRVGKEGRSGGEPGR